MKLNSRFLYLVITCFMICAGLLSRRPELHLTLIVAKYAGSIIWGSMVYFAWSFLHHKQDWQRKAFITAAISIGVEFSQLLHYEWLDAFRRTTIGVLLIGRFFSWWDIASYLCGICIAVLIDRIAFKPVSASQR
jgi:hypothetical protein